MKKLTIALIAALLITTSCSKTTTSTTPTETKPEEKPAEVVETTPPESDATASPTVPEGAYENGAITPNPDSTKVAYSYNGHEYLVDVVAAPTVEVPAAEEAEPVPYAEKLEKMYWSGRPEIGFKKGDYHFIEQDFTKRSEQPYTGDIRIVMDGDDVVSLELNEWCKPDYPDKNWAGYSKRLSGYAFFQAENQRTDNTNMTWTNGATFLEYQMVTEDRLDGDFFTVRGSSNSMRFGFIPIIAEHVEEIKTPSGQYYYGLTKDLGGGISARLVLIMEGDKIVDMWYDEYFADSKDEIASEDDKEFYRQSKYYSRTYKEITEKDFVAFADNLKTQGLSTQKLSDIKNDFEAESFKKEFEHFQQLATEIETLIT